MISLSMHLSIHLIVYIIICLDATMYELDKGIVSMQKEHIEQI